MRAGLRIAWCANIIYRLLIVHSLHGLLTGRRVNSDSNDTTVIKTKKSSGPYISFSRYLRLLCSKPGFRGCRCGNSTSFADLGKWFRIRTFLLISDCLLFSHFTSPPLFNPASRLSLAPFFPSKVGTGGADVNGLTTFGTRNKLGDNTIQLYYIIVDWCWILSHIPVEAHQVETIGEMKSGKWVAYAARALVVRFAKVCDFRILSTHPVLIARPSAESGLAWYPARAPDSSSFETWVMRREWHAMMFRPIDR
jgi:hypothetical protein